MHRGVVLLCCEDRVDSTARRTSLYRTGLGKATGPRINALCSSLSAAVRIVDGIDGTISPIRRRRLAARWRAESNSARTFRNVTRIVVVAMGFCDSDPSRHQTTRTPVAATGGIIFQRLAHRSGGNAFMNAARAAVCKRFGRPTCERPFSSPTGPINPFTMLELISGDVPRRHQKYRNYGLNRGRH